MLSEHISGLHCSGAGQALVDRHVGAAAGGDVDDRVGLSLMRGRNCMKTSGSGVGCPVSGSRACRCRIAAPASAAPMALSAIWSGVIGRRGDCDGTWIEPVMAQVTMTFQRRGGHVCPPVVSG